MELYYSPHPPYTVTPAPSISSPYHFFRVHLCHEVRAQDRAGAHTTHVFLHHAARGVLSSAFHVAVAGVYDDHVRGLLSLLE